jgi:hypothetical protein
VPKDANKDEVLNLLEKSRRLARRMDGKSLKVPFSLQFQLPNAAEHAPSGSYLQQYNL